MPWSGAASHTPKMDDFFPPIAMGDFMPDNQKVIILVLIEIKYTHK